jgi:ABC-type sugar transport system permease subunit
MAGVWIVGVLTTFWATLASVVGLFPGLGDGGLLNDSALPDGFSRGTFELIVFIPIILTFAVGVIFYALGRKTREEIEPTPSEAPADATGVAVA